MKRIQKVSGNGNLAVKHLMEIFESVYATTVGTDDANHISFSS